MKETQLLDETLEILGKHGASEAYAYILNNKGQLESGQIYNFLYCLAGMNGEKDAALAWLREAVVDKGYWYRPTVLEDDDLALIRDEAAFLECKQISDGRYYEALKTAATLCTWGEIKGGKLALVLHGNQQNIHSDEGYWKFLGSEGYQVEYVQSKIIDSHGLFRWEDDGETQLDGVVVALPWDAYESRILCGFSAGCNEILKTLLSTNVKCEQIILHSPWIPIIDDNLDDLLAALDGVNIKIICGENDGDCLPHAKKFAEAATKRGLNCKLDIMAGLGHSYF